MTNEEKARKLAIQSTLDVDDNGNEVYNAFVEAALLEMAAWKDEQFAKEKQALIDNAVRFIRDNIESDRYNSPDEESYRMGCGVDYFETNMFIDEFKQAMKGE